MTSYVSSLIYKQLDYLPFVGSFKEKNLKANFAMPRSLTLDLDLKRLTTLTDRNQAGHETPPPYDRSVYTQFVDKLIDTTWKSGFSQNQQLINRQSIMQGIKLVSIAVDEFDSGNEAIALDVYLSGLDKIIMSLPNLKDEKTKTALKEKLLSLEDRVGIVSKLQQQISDNNIALQQHLQFHQQQDRLITSNSNSNTHKDDLANKFTILSQLLTPTWLITLMDKQEEAHDKVAVENQRAGGAGEGDSLLKFKQLGRTITDIIVQCVVLFKQSPLPGLLYLLFTYFLQLLLLLNQHFQVIEKVQNVGVLCIKKLLAADEKYHLHEFASEALYTFVSATLKAIVAYKETPGFMARTEQQRPRQQQVMKSNWIWSRPAMAM